MTTLTSTQTLRAMENAQTANPTVVETVSLKEHFVRIVKPTRVGIWLNSTLAVMVLISGIALFSVNASADSVNTDTISTTVVGDTTFVEGSVVIGGKN